MWFVGSVFLCFDCACFVMIAVAAVDLKISMVGIAHAAVGTSPPGCGSVRGSSLGNECGSRDRKEQFTVLYHRCRISSSFVWRPYTPSTTTYCAYVWRRRQKMLSRVNMCHQGKLEYLEKAARIGFASLADEMLCEPHREITNGMRARPSVRK